MCTLRGFDENLCRFSQTPMKIDAAACRSVWIIQVTERGIIYSKHKKQLMPTLHIEWTTPTLQHVYVFIIALRKKVNPRLQCFLQLSI